MSMIILSVSGLCYHYEQAIKPLFTNIEFTVSAGWTGVIGANGAGKSTLLKLLCGELELQEGHISAVQSSIYCMQETDCIPENLNDFFQTLYEGDNEAGRLFSLFNMHHDWPYRWESLSHGERKRAQLAAALLHEPELLALDEPTNHLDSKGLKILMEGLGRFDGVGLVVSHDRAFMEELCSGFLCVDAGKVIYRPGTLSQVVEQQEKEKAAALKEYENHKRQYEQLKRTTQETRENAEQRKKNMSKKKLDKKDIDGKARIDGLRLQGKDVIGSMLTRKIQDRRDRALSELSAAAQKKPQYRKSGISMSGTTSKSDFIASLKAGTLKLGEGKVLSFPDLCIRPRDRLALNGSNGSGKSTLIKALIKRGGINKEETLYLPQEYTESDQENLARRFKTLSDTERGELLSHFYRLNGNPAFLQDPTFLSPGEFRKLSLAEGLFKECSLIILDEPTNHLDLPSRIAIEQALQNFAGALLIVSHDIVFRQKLCTIHWEIHDSRLKVGS